MDTVDADTDGFVDDFDSEDLDDAVWTPHYLPAWSSRAQTRAAYELEDSCLRLFVPVGHPVWCEGDHLPPIRVSGIQSGSWSGPVGSTAGQQPFREGQTVLEEQPEHWGWTPTSGVVEMRARMVLSPRSMAALWMVGRERVPEESAEICVVEVFGDAVEPGRSAAIGLGLHAFRDPWVTEDFAAPRLPLDVSEWHTYAVHWSPERADFLVDGARVRSCARPPAYPMQLMLAVFDFPEQSDGHDAHLVPELVVDWVRGSGGSADSQ
ncbi:glycoside hydrolase family 16 protein [Monashia sp. NPDC004114]